MLLFVTLSGVLWLGSNGIIADLAIGIVVIKIAYLKVLNLPLNM
jgi:hypothetical protein